MLKQSKRKKLRHSLNETNISIKEYENRLRTRYNHTQSSSFINTDWATTDNTSISKDKNDDIFSNTESIFKTTKIVSDDHDDDDNVIATRNSTAIPLPPNQIKTIRHPDVNRDYYTNNKKTTTVQIVQFYRGNSGSDDNTKQNPLLYTAGLDCMLNFYRIYSSSTSSYNNNNNDNDNEKNVESNKISGYFFKNFPIRKASFLYNDTNNPKVVLSSRRSYLYIYDAISGTVDTIPKISSRTEKSYENMITSPNGKYIAIYGNDGYVLLLSTLTKRLVQTFKINGNVRSMTFYPTNDNDINSYMLLISGSDGIIYRFDLRYNKCLDMFDNNNDGSTIHSLSTYYQPAPDTFNNSNDCKLAVGSESGIVNIYTLPKSNENNKPILTKSIMNLKTSITNIKPNNNNSSILGLNTSFSRDGLRLLHLQSNTIFSNWPSRNTPLSYVFDFDFSHDNKYLCIGNDKGKCLLYELLHFSS